MGQDADKGGGKEQVVRVRKRAQGADRYEGKGLVRGWVKWNLVGQQGPEEGGIGGEGEGGGVG